MTSADLPTDRLVWIDCEMTGLDPAKDALVEIAVLVTDGELNVLGDGVDLVIAPPDGALDLMDDVVRTMHTRSGLLQALSTGGVPMAEAQRACLDYVKAHVPEQRKAALAGNTVHMDRLFIARDMPELEGWLHYRNVDVSSFKELAKRWYPQIVANGPAKHGNHRALGDIVDSVRELRFYRATMLVPAPGPAVDLVKAAAADVTPPANS